MGTVHFPKQRGHGGWCLLERDGIPPLEVLSALVKYRLREGVALKGL